MSRSKLSEDEIDRKIASLREKNKMIEEKHKMVQEEKRRDAEALKASRLAQKKTYNKNGNFSNAYMDGNPDYVSDESMKGRRMRYQHDGSGDYHNNYRDNGRYQRGGYRPQGGRGDGRMGRPQAYNVSSPDNYKRYQRQNQTENESSYPRRYSKMRYQQNSGDEQSENKSEQYEPEEDSWQTRKNYLYDPSRDLPGEFKKSYPPRSVQYNPRNNRSSRSRGRGRMMMNRENMELQMTGRQRIEHKRWLQQREEADRERIARAQAKDGQWRRAWDVQKNQDESKGSEGGGGRRRRSYDEEADRRESSYNTPRRRGGKQANGNRRAERHQRGDEANERPEEEEDFNPVSSEQERPADEQTDSPMQNEKPSPKKDDLSTSIKSQSDEENVPSDEDCPGEDPSQAQDIESGGESKHSQASDKGEEESKFVDVEKTEDCLNDISTGAWELVTTPRESDTSVISSKVDDSINEAEEKIDNSTNEEDSSFDKSFFSDAGNSNTSGVVDAQEDKNVKVEEVKVEKEEEAESEKTESIAEEDSVYVDAESSIPLSTKSDENIEEPVKIIENDSSQEDMVDAVEEKLNESKEEKEAIDPSSTTEDVE